MSRLSGALCAPPRLTRRGFLRLVVIGSAAVVWTPGCDSGPRFFTDPERQTLAALADYVLPPDDAPGGAAIGVVPYVEALLTALESDPPRLYAAGPMSNRNPTPRPDGTPSDVYPKNAFQDFLPLTREQELAWRLLLYGSAGVPGGGPNDAVLGPTVGLRSLFRSSLQQVLDLAQVAPDHLDFDAIDAVWGRLPGEFRAQLAQLCVQAVVCLPEYGGNIDQKGWRLIHYLGDSAPLGFTPFDETAGVYRTRPGEPFSERDTRPDPDPLDTETLRELEIIIRAAGGRRFF